MLTSYFAHFNPRSPCGERLAQTQGTLENLTFQSTLPVWGATIDDLSSQLSVMLISIHAPRVGSDGVVEAIDVFQEISIHAPRVGSDFAGVSSSGDASEFQSTLPVWGATIFAVPATWP